MKKKTKVIYALLIMTLVMTCGCSKSDNSKKGATVLTSDEGTISLSQRSDEELKEAIVEYQQEVLARDLEDGYGLIVTKVLIQPETNTVTVEVQDKIEQYDEEQQESIRQWIMTMMNYEEESGTVNIMWGE